MNVLQIVPRLPPPAEGVGSYALALARALEARGVRSRFLAADPPAEGWETEGFDAVAIPAGREPAALAGRLDEAETVLLHYANYGYQRRGCPAWLLRAVRRWRRGGPRRRLVTVFHEVYATGPPWRSSFWTWPLQRRIAAAVAGISDALVTSLDLYVRRIGPAAAGKAAVTPVFSTVGEPPEPPPLAGRARRMVLFGGRGARGRAWGELRPDLLAACRALGIEEIAEVGPSLGGAEGALDGIPVRRLGALPAAEVGRLLLGARAGFVAYPAFFLPKSTIFAAYCAHGVLPVQAWRRRSRPGGTAPRWTGAGDPQAVAGAAHAWYRGHSLERQAERFHDLLAGRA